MLLSLVLLYIMNLVQSPGNITLIFKMLSRIPGAVKTIWSSKHEIMYQCEWRIGSVEQTDISYEKIHSHRITWFLGFVRRPEFCVTRKHSVPETASVSVRWGQGDTDFVGSLTKTQWLRLAFSKGPNTVGVSLPSLEDEIRPNFRNAVE
jgi:hypothetical protein